MLPYMFHLILEDFGYTEWAQWGECSKTCNGGIRKRKRTCNETVIGCPGKSEHSGECNTKPCPGKFDHHFITEIFGYQE